MLCTSAADTHTPIYMYTDIVWENAFYIPAPLPLCTCAPDTHKHMYTHTYICVCVHLLI